MNYTKQNTSEPTLNGNKRKAPGNGRFASQMRINSQAKKGKNTMNTNKTIRNEQRRKRLGFNPQVINLMLIIIALLTVLPCLAQNNQYSNNQAGQTLRSNGRVNPSTLGLEMTVPLAGYPGRGGSSVPVSLSYSSKVWRIRYDSTNPRQGYINQNCYSHNTPVYSENSASGWTSSLGLAYVEYTGESNFYSESGHPTQDLCDESEPYNEVGYVKRIQVHLPSGESHELRASDTPVMSSVTSPGTVDMTGTYYAVDGSKLKYVDNGSGTYRLWLPNGSYYDFASTKVAYLDQQIRKGLSYTDTSGNVMTFNAATTTYPNGYWTDTIGRTIPVPLSPTAAPAAAGTQDYYLPGITNPYKFVWKQLKGSTAGDSGLTDFSDSLHYKAGRTTGSSHHSPALFGDGTDAWSFDAGAPLFNPIVLTEIELPNGSKYEFSYNVYGEIDKIVYPTGGEEHFTLGQVTPLGGQYAEAPFKQASRGVTERKVYENSSATPMTSTYAMSANGDEVTSTAPDGSYTIRYLHAPTTFGPSCTACSTLTFGFDTTLAGMAYEERAYSASNQLLSKKLTTWAESSGYRHPRVTKEESVIYDPANSSNLLSTATTMAYSGTLTDIDNPLNVVETKQYGFSTTVGTLGSLEKSVETDYSTDGNYTSQNIKGLPIETRVKDSSGNVKAKSQIAYDESGYGSGYRGLPTTQKSWTDIAGNLSVQTHTKYDSYGNVTEATDALGNVTATEYSSTYSYAYPTKVTTAVPDSSGTNGSSTAFETTSTYDSDTGQVLTTTDANGQTTTMEYNDDLLRPTKVTPPSGAGITEMIYTDTPGAMSVKTKTQIDSTNYAESTVYADGLGRTIKSEKKDNAGNVFVETQYDNMGRAFKSSNPYRSGDTVLWTQTAFDSFGRVHTVTTPDSAVITTDYDLSLSGTLATIVTVTDQASKVRRSLTNGLGQLIRVDEPDGSGSLGTLSSPNQATSYLYDTLGKMVKVTQGAQSRYFKYDDAGRLLRVRQPEQGTNSSLSLSDAVTGNSDWSAGFTYDANGNVLTATDTKGTVITNTYDHLNRAVTRTYSDSTPAVTNYYDNSSISYSKGKLTKTTNSVSTSEILSLDNLGRVLSSRQTTDGTNYDSSYTYNLAGAVLEETYPSGRVVKNTLATDGTLSKIETKESAGSYATRAENFGYAAHGAISKLEFGSGKWENAQFNSRLQVTQLGLGTSATDQSLWKLDYDFGMTDNNGNIKSQTTTMPSIYPLIQTFTYDSLDRLKSATETSNTVQTWKQTFTYDRYGNRNFDAANTTTLGSCATAVCNPTFDTNTNRFATGQGYTYDLAGNITTDPDGKQFTFNGDNKQTEVKDASNNVIGTYYYDGDGKRIKKVTANETTTFVYSGGKLVAEYLLTSATPTTPTTQYFTTDMLESPRVITDGLGNIVSRRDFMPFGEEINGLGGRSSSIGYTSDTIRQKFTGYEKDDETGLDFAEARYYNSKNGRFTAVDPLLASGKSANPQTFNRYAYSLNSPLVMSDPSGMQTGKWYTPVTPDGSPDTTRKYAYIKNGASTDGYSEVTRRNRNGDLVGASNVGEGYEARFNPMGPYSVRSSPLDGGSIYGLTGNHYPSDTSSFNINGWDRVKTDEYEATFIEHPSDGYAKGSQEVGIELFLAVEGGVGLGRGIGKAAMEAALARPSGLGDLTIGEVRTIQSIVNEAERPLEVVGSAATGTRRGVGSDLPIGKGPGTRSDIDYVIPHSSVSVYESNGLNLKLPSIGDHGIVPGMHNPYIGPAIRFEPQTNPFYVPQKP